MRACVYGVRTTPQPPQPSATRRSYELPLDVGVASHPQLAPHLLAEVYTGPVCDPPALVHPILGCGPLAVQYIRHVVLVPWTHVKHDCHAGLTIERVGQTHEPAEGLGARKRNKWNSRVNHVSAGCPVAY